MWILSCSPGATEGGLDQHETQSVGPPTPTPQGFRLEAGRESLSWEPPGRPQGQESQVVVGGAFQNVRRIYHPSHQNIR